MKATIKDNTLTVVIPLQPPTPSKTGKSHIVASTQGFTATTVLVDGKPVRLNLTAII